MNDVIVPNRCFSVHASVIAADVDDADNNAVAKEAHAVNKRGYGAVLLLEFCS